MNDEDLKKQAFDFACKFLRQEHAGQPVDTLWDVNNAAWKGFWAGYKFAQQENKNVG